MSDDKENQVQIELSPEMADGIYSNLAVQRGCSDDAYVQDIAL